MYCSRPIAGCFLEAMLDTFDDNPSGSLWNNRWLLIGSLLLFALVLNREGDHMPTGNEFVYLLYFYKGWHPTFLSTDWTFQEPTAGHAIFNYACGWLTRLMPLKAAAWLGRLSSWMVTLIGLFRLGRHFKIAPWAVGAGIFLWMLQRQSPVTGEWMIGTFEAKVIAYPCLLFAIDAALSGRSLLAGILAGLAFSFHSAVGMWGGAALGLMVLLHYPIRKTLEFSVAAIVCSLPGLITSWNLVMGPHAISRTEAKYLTTISLPDCFDAAGFPHTWVALLLILPIFAGMFARWKRDDRAVWQLMIFQIALACFFAFGVVSRIIGRFDRVELFPMRVWATFALLLFYWQIMSIVQSLINRKPVPKSLCAAAIVLFLAMPSPILQLRDMIASHVAKYLHPARAVELTAKGNDADFIAAAKWVSANTPENDVVIAPPWRNDGFYYIRRPLIANWHAPRYDALTEWQQRIESLVGDTSNLTYEDAMLGEMAPREWSYYANLSADQIQNIRTRIGEDGKPWGGKWLITTGHYPYRLAFSAGSYSVYALPVPPSATSRF
jgi:hypothetical protein